MSVEAITNTSVNAESLNENWKKWRILQKVSEPHNAARIEYILWSLASSLKMSIDEYFVFGLFKGYKYQSNLF